MARATRAAVQADAGAALMRATLEAGAVGHEEAARALRKAADAPYRMERPDASRPPNRDESETT